MSVANLQPNSAQQEDAEDVGPASEPSRPTDPRFRPPPMRDSLSTLNEEDFDFHDTIPAPPWLDEALEPEVPPSPTR